MKLGLFTMPSHPPERSLADGHDWDLQTLQWADELGYEEAWIGEHHTSVWEPHPAPDLLVVEGLRHTKNIRIGVASSCRTTTRRSSRTAWPCSTTSRAAA